MIPQGQYESLHKLVFGQRARAVYAVMDGAMIEGLPGRLAEIAPDAACLFEGALDPMLSAVWPDPEHEKSADGHVHYRGRNWIMRSVEAFGRVLDSWEQFYKKAIEWALEPWLWKPPSRACPAWS